MKYKTKAIKSFLLLMSIMLVITGCGLLELGSKNKSTKEPLCEFSN